ncbi:MAG: exodeoxyribonuclease V subunit gamma [Planctomycetes bacterium]|nr:exodeoxyribonuclease V subunit gamma [Planctomycetota bacterium]
MPAGLTLYHSHRLEELLEALAMHLHSAPLPPLATETVVVPGQGLARWVQLQLARRLGIAAGLSLPFPGAFLASLLADPHRGGADLFGGTVLPLRLWRLLGADHTGRFGPATSYCQDDDGPRRLQLCTRLAACFDDCQLYRADLLERMAAGDDLAEFGALGHWQAELWRALLADAGIAGAPPKPRGRGRPPKVDTATKLLFPELGATAPDTAHRLRALRTLLADPARAQAALPPRLAVFGATTLPPQFLDLLLQIAAHIPVALFVPTPTPLAAGEAPQATAHPLLRRFGRQARDFAVLLNEALASTPVPVARLDVAALGRRNPEQPVPEPAPVPSLLQRLQRDLVAGAVATEPHPLADGDDSLRVHDCHAPQRELEVVRDQILAAFAADPTLEPHDVLVLVPDVLRYAPFAEAVFGPVRDFLPFHIADKTPAAELPLCAALLAVLQLARERLPLHEVLHLLEQPAVQRRFGLHAGDLPALRDRCRAAGIRWGLDAEWRARHCAMPAFAANSWRQGLDRLLLGAATGPQDDLVANLLPVADATSSRDANLARFCDFAETLFAQLEGLGAARPFAAWADAIDALLAALFAARDAEELQAVAHLQQATAALREAAAAARCTEAVALPVLQDWLAAALRSATGARGFLAGAVTVAALLPMRMVPVRHLFLCGLDDGSFPRRDQPAPFDLLAARPRTGDRSTRLDDRQLFVDALLAARQRLHVTFVGRSAKDDSELTPSAAVVELLDLVERTAGAKARAQVRVRHPLQPWSERYRDGADPRLFTFGGDATSAARGTTAATPWCQAATALLAEPALQELAISRLEAFWRNPSRAFLQRLGVSLPRTDDRETDSEPFAVHSLDRYQLGEQRVRRTLRGEAEPHDPVQHALATGLLPVGGLGAIHHHDLDQELRAFLGAVTAHGTLRRVPIEVSCAGVRVHGELEAVAAEVLLVARPAALKTKDLLRGWILHVLAAVARHRGQHELPERTLVLGRDKGCMLQPLAADVAQTTLATLLRGFQLGQTQPLPFFEHASAEFVKVHDKDQEQGQDAALAAARSKFATSDTGHSGDLDDAAVRLCYRDRDPIAAGPFVDWALAVHGPLRAAGGSR